MAYSHLGAASVLLISQAAAEPISTDRPGNGTSPATVARGAWQVETSALYATAPGPDVVSFPTLLRFGGFEPLELRLGSGLVGVEINDGASATDTSLGAKLRVAGGAGLQPELGVAVDVFLPSGQGPFTSDAVVFEARLAAAWSLPAGFGALANAGLEVASDDAGRFARIVFVANVSYGPPGLDGALVFFAESFGRLAAAEGRDHLLQIDAGGAYRLSDDWQVDLFSQHGLTDAAPDLQLAVGVSARL